MADLFCGCGGSSTGAAAVADAEVRLAVNHWERAVESHAANHPDADAVLTDLHEVHPACFEPMTALLASPECTTHSPSSGLRRSKIGQLDAFDRCDLTPAQVKSRATMWTVVHWASVHRPEFVIVENVVEIHYWPELAAWLGEMHTLGYEHERVYVNAMHIHGLLDSRIEFMAPQSRDRIYVVFWKRGNPKPDLSINPPAYCAACESHVKSVQAWKNTKQGRQRWGRYGRQYEYRCPHCSARVEPWSFAALNAIDWTLPAIRIGDRERHGLRPLGEKTRARIKYGLEKYGLHSYQVTTRYSSGLDCRVKGADEVLPTQPSQPVVGIVETAFSHAPATRFEVANAPFRTLTGRATKALVLANRTHGQARSSLERFPTINTGSNIALITTHRGTSKSHSGSQPFTTVTAGGINHGIVTSEAAQLTLRGSRSLDGLDDPLGVVVASAQQIGVLSRHPLLVQYYGSLNASSTTEPMPTATGHDRHGLVDGEGDELPEVDDLCFRMLQPEELKVGTGHPADYVLVGTKRDRVKLVGNSNYPGIEQLLLQRCKDTLE
ncbi:MAG: DNA cytosine methyltransferase [Pseudomonadota bacterium]